MVGESVSRRHEMPAEQVAEDDYQSFCEALGSSARGRAFLEEFARRNRQADTEVVLAALDRLEATARSQAATSPDADRIRQDLRALLDTLRSARPQTENTPTAIKAATLAALIDFVQARIEALVMMPAREGETLSAVPVEEQPELPIPHPAATATPVMALVQEPVRIAPAAAEDAPSPFVAPQAKRKTATIIPIVEFDYRAHQNGRPIPARYAPEESWSALAPPAVALPAATPPLPEVAAPEKPFSEATEIETYELWLDPPAVAGTMTEASKPEPTAPIDAVLDSAASSPVVSEITVTEIAAADTATADAAAPASSADAAMTTIETLMQQMEQTSAPAPIVKGHVEAADPLTPLMALSEDERIALFT